MTADTAALQLRPLDQPDLAVAAVLHAGCFERAWGEPAIAEILAMPGSFGILAYLREQPAGLIIALAVSPDAEILTLGVLPHYRRRGIAARLLASVMERLRGVGCERLLLEVSEKNAAALALYGRLGFAQVGRRPSYYRRATGAETAALLLARPLDRRVD